MKNGREHIVDLNMWEEFELEFKNNKNGGKMLLLGRGQAMLGNPNLCSTPPDKMLKINKTIS
jgi:hypothetical protein